ncbi:MAG: F0F1 ATP synthase subunit gamma [Candidatus Omnitrophota bacterium]
MIPIAKLKKEMIYNKSLKDGIDVLKLLSTSEFNKLLADVPKENIAEKHIIDCFALLRAKFPNAPFLTSNGKEENASRFFLLVCSDEGFLGDVNVRIISACLKRRANGKDRFFVLGSRGASLTKDLGDKHTVFSSIKDETEIEDRASEITDAFMKLYRKEKYDFFYAAYMKFYGFGNHQARAEQILPCEDFSKVSKPRGDEEDIIIKSTYKAVTEYLIKVWIKNALCRIFWSNKLSEWSIKVMQLEHSADELKDMTDELKFRYFKTCHALNDKVIREIFAAKMVNSE